MAESAIENGESSGSKMQKSKIVKTILLNGPSASRIAEIRTFLHVLKTEGRLANFGIGELVELDDDKFVHIMKRIDEELERRGQPHMFFKPRDGGFISDDDWKTLSILLNTAYIRLRYIKTWHECQLLSMLKDRKCADYVFSEIDITRAGLGISSQISKLPKKLYRALCRAMEDELQQYLKDYAALVSEDDALDDKTVVMKFSRGPSPIGYAQSYPLVLEFVPQEATAIIYASALPRSIQKEDDLFDHVILPCGPGGDVNLGPFVTIGSDWRIPVIVFDDGPADLVRSPEADCPDKLHRVFADIQEALCYTK